MKCRNTIWLSLVCGITLACSPVLAQGPQQDAPPPPPNGQQPGARPSSPLPPLPSLSPGQRDAQRMISGPYRLTYTLTEMDGNKRVGSQRYAMILDSNAAPTHLNLGAKIPVYYSTHSSSYSYVDVGLKIDANLRQFANGIELFTKVAQTGLAQDPDSATTHASGGSGDADRTAPVIQQSQLETAALLTENRSTILGQLDQPGSTHSLRIEVELTRVQ